jgi:tRNA-2-methylthio-N6-dimethylallyladenosine synthase
MVSKTFFIKTFGCQMNERDSEIMSQSLIAHGHRQSLAMENSDIVIINTCSIRAKAEQKVMSLLGMLRKEKILRPWLKICVAGCVAQQEGEHLLNRMPHVDLIVGTQNIYHIADLIENKQPGNRVVTSMSDSYSIPRFIPETVATAISPEKTSLHDEAPPFKKFVTIMQGCNNFCTYCIVPYTRGREISRNKKDIIDEVKVLVDDGVKEVTLLGQNVNSYGIANRVSEDDALYTFPALLHEVAAINGLERLRFTTSHPKDLSDALIRCFKDIQILCHQIHLPVQAGSDAILQKMNRKYTIEKYLKKVDILRSYCPDIAITTDVIVGFPGETEDDFQKTMDLLEIVRYDGSFSFKYSDRPGTKSAGLSGKLDEKIKTERLSRFQTRQNAISLEKNRAFVGRTLKIMVESIQPEGLQGRTEYNHVVHCESGTDHLPGEMIVVHIDHAGEHSLQAHSI